MSAPAGEAVLATVERIAETIRARSEEPPAVGLVLGSGLGPAAEPLEDTRVIPYGDLPGFPATSVAGHAGRLLLGRFAGVQVAVMQGRVHAYEGFAPWQVALPARVLCRLGIRLLVVTNAAGAVRADLVPGRFLRLSDHLNLTGGSPLTGPNDARLGPRFPDLSRAYDPAAGALLDEAARRAGIPLEAGVYAGVAGPAYETPAEIRMLRTLGADVVGMSTVHEVIAAAHMGVPVVGLSCITNHAAGVSPTPLTHEEVEIVARAAAGTLRHLLEVFLPMTHHAGDLRGERGAR